MDYQDFQRVRQVLGGTPPPALPPSAGIPLRAVDAPGGSATPAGRWDAQWRERWNEAWNAFFNQEWTRTHSDQGARVYADWAMGNLPEPHPQHLPLAAHAQMLLNPFSPQGVVTTTGNVPTPGVPFYGGKSF